ncbi:lysozyme [Mucilaginibacter xinganensis]|uniref:Lysozyme n=1 Tax=Mucilaginibacter xinganensis TaxID=1234841 RepID=A0A223NU22_9SPHI|nr:lysozyme [Mucilaginibacter xinganensis]ASU33138.1 Lysozyme RrrD [Mucilaginibacter xinganensis]
MQLSEQGLKLIKSFEGMRLNAYRDTAGVWTIGYGSTRYNDAKRVKPGDKLANESVADTLFRKTLGDYQNAVNKFVTVPLTQNQFDALVSFAYNTGTGALKASTLLTKLNETDYAGAAAQFLIWNKITDPKSKKKIVSDALVTRRKKESQLFLSTTKT